MGQTGCGSFIINVSTFINTEFEETLENHLDATVTFTEEGTGKSITDFPKLRNVL